MALPRPADASPLNLTLDVFVAQGFSLQISLGPSATLDIVDGTFNIGIFTDGMTRSGPPGDHLPITGSLDFSNPTGGVPGAGTDSADAAPRSRCPRKRRFFGFK